MPIEYAVLLAMLTASLGFVMHRLLDFSRAKESQTATEIRNSSLQDENAQLKKRILALEADITNLQSQLRPYIERDRLCSALRLADDSHTLVDESGNHYCIPCLEKTPPEQHQLEPLASNYKCHTCGATVRKRTTTSADKAAEYASRPAPSAIIAAGAMNQHPPFTQG